jgi:hypothetical protein
MRINSFIPVALYGRGSLTMTLPSSIHSPVFSAAIALATASMAAPVHAGPVTVVTFDGWAGPFVSPLWTRGVVGSVSSLPTTPNGYAGFTWAATQTQSSTGVPAGSVGLYQPDANAANGFTAALPEGGTAIFNSWAGAIRVTRSERWSFVGATFTAAWSSGLTISIRGFRDGAEVASQQVVLGNPTGPTAVQVSPTFSDLDELQLSSSGGAAYWNTGGGTQFIVDDFAYFIPSPGPLTLLLGSLGCIWGPRRRA